MRLDFGKGRAKNGRVKHSRSRQTASQVSGMAADSSAADERLAAGQTDAERKAAQAVAAMLRSPAFWLPCAAFMALFAWSYWPTLGDLVDRWTDVADYSHGFLVAPVALYFLWAKRERFPLDRRAAYVAGLAVVAVAELLRVAGGRMFLTSIDGWTIPLWLAGFCLLLGGWRLLRWCWSSLAFLLLMVPLPYRVERLLSSPLQSISCSMSTWLLQCMGQPAIREGNTVHLGDIQLEVARACSGSRIFMSIAAIAFVYCVLISAPWWTKLSVWFSVLPIALVANALRITATGLLHIYFSGKAARAFSHDASGWAMLPVAAAMMAAVVWYVGRLLREERMLTTRQSLARGLTSGV